MKKCSIEGTLKKKKIGGGEEPEKRNKVDRRKRQKGGLKIVLPTLLRGGFKKKNHAEVKARAGVRTVERGGKIAQSGGKE